MNHLKALLIFFSIRAGDIEVNWDLGLRSNQKAMYQVSLMPSVAMVQAQTFNKPDFLNRVFSSSHLTGANPGCTLTPSVVLSNVSLKG